MSMYENAAALLVWRVLRFTPAQQWTAAAITAIAEAARAAGGRCLASFDKAKDH